MRCKAHGLSNHRGRAPDQVPGSAYLELSCGVRSLQQAPWWNAGRRARSAERVPHRKMRRMEKCACRRSASFRFVARVERSETRERHPSRTFVPGFRSAQSGLLIALSMIKPKAGPTVGLRCDAICSEDDFTIGLGKTRARIASRERVYSFRPLPACGERSSEARVRGPLRDSERCNSEPSGNAPSPRARGGGGIAISPKVGHLPGLRLGQSSQKVMIIVYFFLEAPPEALHNS